MAAKRSQAVRWYITIPVTLALFAVLAVPVAAGEYAALTGVKGLDSVYDVSLGSPNVAAIVFPAIRDSFLNKEVRALPAPPRTVMVFHGKAVKYLSTDRTGLEKEEVVAYDRVAEMLRQFKKDGIKLEVCMYAVKVVGVDPATLLPEIDQVGNGFISVLGYQAQGYSVVTVP